MKKVALLIGVSEYQPGLNSLPAAVKDVAAMQRVLLDKEMGGFDLVMPLLNPDSQTIQYEIETLLSNCHKDDLILLFYSGHGIKDDSGKLYFASHNTCKDTRGNLIRSTAVPATFVHEVLNNSRAKRQVIILDCCFSGAFDPTLQIKSDRSIDLYGQLGAEGRVVLTSSSSTQYSFEQEDAELSLYTRYLIEGIETGAGDQDEDGKISVLELHEYAAARVQETAPKMTPKLITLKDVGFGIVLATAKIADPRLKYRKQAEKYVNRGEIRTTARAILDTLRANLQLPSEVTKEIEHEILKPSRKHLENIQRYKKTLIAELEHEYPLSQTTRLELNDFQELLGLRKEDIEPIERQEFAKRSVRRQSAKFLAQPVEQFLKGAAISTQALATTAQLQNTQIQESVLQCGQPGTLKKVDVGLSLELGYVQNQLKQLQQTIRQTNVDVTQIEQKVRAQHQIVSTPQQDESDATQATGQPYKALEAAHPIAQAQSSIWLLIPPFSWFLTQLRGGALDAALIALIVFYFTNMGIVLAILHFRLRAFSRS